MNAIFHISPKHTLDDFKNGWTLEDKIEVFVARVDGWQLGVAKQIVDRNIPDRGFALLMIVTSIFEMLGKYRDGYTSGGKSEYYFKEGVRWVFPGIEESLDHPDEMMHSLYLGLRNPLYHLGMAKSSIMLIDQIPGSLGFREVDGQFQINPDTLVQDLSIKFAEYAQELRNPTSGDLRAKFEKRFDFDDVGTTPSSGPRSKADSE